MEFENILFPNFRARKKHHLVLLKKLQHFTYLLSHCWIKYCGPWIEEEWRDKFIAQPYENFGPFIPLFVQWLDLIKIHEFDQERFHNTLSSIFQLLKKDFLYITVSQSELGLEVGDHSWNEIPPNLLIFSPSSRGHIPSPFLMEELQPTTTLRATRKFIFLGSHSGREFRREMIQWFEDNFPDDFFNNYTTDWIEEYRKSEIILSPRGEGRGCFRTFEILQLGLIPFVIHDQVNWLPYLNSTVPWNEMILIFSLDG
jgi:hypothetical protein